MSAIVSTSAAPGWWVLAGREGSQHRTPLVAWALLEDGTVEGLHVWLSDGPVLVTEGAYMHESEFRTCRCDPPTPHSGGFDPGFCIDCAGLIR